MRIAQAISILEDVHRYIKPDDQYNEHDAIQLGIEALKIIEQIHIADGTQSGLLLPGQTKE